ncbi:MAG: hypothetical protein LIP16_20695 [Clostridium sp.]|nr:hypothetical protein [Clostridium sp.]
MRFRKKGKFGICFGEKVSYTFRVKDDKINEESCEIGKHVHYFTRPGGKQL